MLTNKNVPINPIKEHKFISNRHARRNIWKTVKRKIPSAF